MEVNSSDWWEDYFQNHWEKNDGRAQTATFMNEIVKYCPDLNNLCVLDWGCALGEGVFILSKKFPSANVVGLDRSSVAVNKAKSNYPNNNFICGELSEKFDVIVASACLEHFYNPIDIIKNHLKFVNKYYILLVPYKESPLIGCHFFSFDENSFPEEIDGFKKSYKILPSNYGWAGQMILVVYEK